MMLVLRERARSDHPPGHENDRRKGFHGHASDPVLRIRSASAETAEAGGAILSKGGARAGGSKRAEKTGAFGRTPARASRSRRFPSRRGKRMPRRRGRVRERWRPRPAGTRTRAGWRRGRRPPLRDRDRTTERREPGVSARRRAKGTRRRSLRSTRRARRRTTKTKWGRPPTRSSGRIPRRTPAPPRGSTRARERRKVGSSRPSPQPETGSPDSRGPRAFFRRISSSQTHRSPWRSVFGA